MPRQHLPPRQLPRRATPRVATRPLLRPRRPQPRRSNSFTGLLVNGPPRWAVSIGAPPSIIQTMIKLFAGLGNPGPEYEATRHNAGFWWVDALARELKVPLVHDKSYHGL